MGVALIMLTSATATAGLNDAGVKAGGVNVVTPSANEVKTPEVAAKTDSAKQAAEEKAKIVETQTKIETEDICTKHLARARKMNPKADAKCYLSKTMPQCNFECEGTSATKTTDSKQWSLDGLTGAADAPAVQEVRATKASSRTTSSTKATTASSKPRINTDAPSSDDEEETRSSAAKSTPKGTPTDAAKDSTGEGGTPKAANSDPAEASTPAEVSANESAELGQCQSLASEASAACNYTDDADYGSATASIAGSCEQIQNAGIKSASAKKDAARACSDKGSVCARACKTSADKYTESENWSVFDGRVNSCIALQSKAEDLSTASADSVKASKGGTACDEASSQSPQSAGGSSDPAAVAQSAEAKAAACAMTPNAAGCAEAAQYAAAKASMAGFNQVDTSKGSINTGDTSGLNVGPQFASGEPAASAGGAKNGTIANNTGGGIPGGGGGGAGGKGGGGGLGGMLAAAASSLADIEKGFLGGGYSQLLNGENPWSNEPPEGGPGASRALASLGVKDIDLKRYLPGGDLARQGSLMLPYSTEFHSRGVDLFSRIHDRYDEKCRLGELLDCR